MSRIPNQGRTFNEKTSRWRKPWFRLDEAERQRRFRQAQVAFENGVSEKDPGTFPLFAKHQSALDKYQRPATAVRLGKKMPPLFGSSARTQILAILWATGPITVRELARLRQKDSAATFRSVERLIQCGLLVKLQRTGSRRYVSVNRSQPAFRALRRLLECLIKEYRVECAPQSAGRCGFPSERSNASRMHDEKLFGSPARSQLLILLAALGSAYARRIARALGLDESSITYMAHSLQKSGIITIQRVDGTRIMRLSMAYGAAKPFYGYLKSIANEHPRYKSLARAATTIA